MEKSYRFIQMDEEGYLMVDDLRVADLEIGAHVRAVLIARRVSENRTDDEHGNRQRAQSPQNQARARLHCFTQSAVRGSFGAVSLTSPVVKFTAQKR